MTVIVAPKPSPIHPARILARRMTGLLVRLKMP